MPRDLMPKHRPSPAGSPTLHNKLHNMDMFNCHHYSSALVL